MKWKFWGKEIKPDCECEEYCPCKKPHEKCWLCNYYRQIDSGYGYCIALPQVIVVPWCRIICSLFKRVPRK